MVSVDGNAGYRTGILVGVISLLLLSTMPLLSKSKKEKKEDANENQAVFKVSSRVVVLSATATDKKGNPVKDLTAEDFRVYDNGELQPIQTFALESFGDEGSGDSQTPGDRSDGTAPAQGPTRAPLRSRMISIVIDDLTAGPDQEYPRIIDAVREFVAEEMGPGDQIALLSGSRKVQIPFSDNKRHLLEELALVPDKLEYSATMRPCGPELTDLEAQTTASGQTSPYHLELERICEEGFHISLHVAATRQQGDSEFRTHSLLQTIRQHLRALKHFKGSKNVVVFSDGIVAQKGTATAYMLQEVVDLALRSGIVLNTVGIRGVKTYSELLLQKPADGENRGGGDERAVGVTWRALPNDPSWKISLHTQDKLAQETPLMQMASDTGGMFHGGNFMDKGLREIARRPIVFYAITYGMPEQREDGVYHDIKLGVTRPGVELSYRKGYYTPKEELSFETRKKEDIIAALSAPGNMNEIPVALAYNYFQEDDLSYSVSFISDVKIRGVQFYSEDARRRNVISLILAAYDENDRYINGVEKAIDFRLLEESYAGLLDYGLTSRVELKLPMGRYKIKAVVRENNQGKMGSAVRSLEIP